MVMEVETFSRGIPSKRVSMSSSESMATPTLPTSPCARGASESNPICVGRSNATERSEEHTSELQSRLHLVCRLLLEKKKNTHPMANSTPHACAQVQSTTAARDRA